MSSDFTPQTSPMEDWFHRFWYRILKCQADNQYYLQRQYQIGYYYADFVHLATRTIVEIDGKDFHFANKEQMIYDLRRQAYLEEQGYTVLRFTGSQVRNCAVQCVQVVRNHITTRLEELS